MSEHHLASSFGNPKAQPQTPLQTLTSLNFPSPVFDTPKQYQGSFLEPGSLTPRFAEEYSVFNSTPGNLRGSQGPFTDFLHATSSFSAGHKRLLSCEGLASDTAAHVDHVPSDSVDPSCRLTPSSAAPSSGPEASSADSDIPPSPHFSRRRFLKKFRQQADARRPDRAQFLSPPPSTHKDERRLALALAVNMPRDHFSQQENAEPAHHDMSAMIGNSGDLFAYPLSATASAPTTFWDPSMSMSMDMDFGVAGHGSVHAPHPSSHRHTGSFDWNAEIQLFQDVNVPAPTINQEGAQPMRRERLQASKPPSSGPPATSASESLTHRTALDPFSIMDPGEGVDPGLLFGRPQTSALDSAFSLLPREVPAGSVSALSAKNQAETLRRTKSAKGTRTAKLPDRALAGSPIKSLGRPGLGRSYSENRGKRTVGRPTHPAMAAADAGWSMPTAPKASGDAGASSSRMGCGRPSGRVSPAKLTGRMPMLASIPEAISQHGPRTSVRLNIDSYGRARAETTVIGDGSLSDRELDRARMARAWDSSDDNSSTDNEPIIIPSRSTSFTLPDPRQSVGSNFHPSSRGTSDRSRSNSANGADSATETVIVLDRQHKGGDATSELRKVVEDRQKRSNRVSSARSHRFDSTLAGSFPSGIISPTSLADYNHGQGGLGVRCVCDDNSADETDCFMVQCESCDMWLHGSCVNVTRHTMPRVYICCFCMRTPKKTAKRGRESVLGVGGLLSPLASKSFHSFR